MKNGVCFDCPNRQQGCHGTCAAYLGEVERAKAEKAARAKENLLHNYVNDSIDKQLPAKKRKVRRIGNNN